MGILVKSFLDISAVIVKCPVFLSSYQEFYLSVILTCIVDYDDDTYLTNKFKLIDAV